MLKRLESVAILSFGISIYRGVLQNLYWMARGHAKDMVAHGGATTTPHEGFIYSFEDVP